MQLDRMRQQCYHGGRPREGMCRMILPQINPAAITWMRLAIVLVSAGILGTALFLLIAYYQLQSIRTQGEDFVSTLRRVPITVPLALDALDLGLDFLGAPFAWFVLGSLGLGGLQAVALIESLIPGTQLVPLLTICWVGVRLWGQCRRSN